MRVFLTGATGVVGRRAVPLLVAAGHTVTAATRRPANAGLAEAGATVVAADLFDRDALRRAVDGHDAVVHLATHMPATLTRMMLPWAFAENDRVRKEGSANLADAVLATGVSRYVQESFAPVYADRGDAWLDESTPLEPAPYNRTVLDAERSAERVAAAGRAAVVLRFAAFYGADSRFFVEALGTLRRGLAPIPGPPEAYVSSVSHDDAATAVLAALNLPAGAYTVTDDTPVTRREYLAAMADAFAVPAPGPMPWWLAKLMGSAGALLSRSQRMSNAKLRSHGWSPRHPSVVEGFRATAAELAR